MLDDVIVVQSAVSAFNNAALWTPAFLWWAVLALPLFVFIYKYADMLNNCWDGAKGNMLQRVSVWVAGLTLVWVVLFGGAYDVLRDSLSVLPMMVATIVFLTSLFVSSHLRKYPLPRMVWWRWLLVIAFVALVAVSDLHVWWGPLLQVGALGLGGVLGRVAKAEMRPVAGTVLIVMSVAVAMLMQPEFFRFGQLGNLTVAHLVAMLCLGGVAMATVAVTNVKAMGKIKNSVFAKLKWLMRVGCALGVALFILTEAVPVFLGTLVVLFAMFAMSVFHSAKSFDDMGDVLFAIMLMGFGVITVMPVITVMGILLLKKSGTDGFWGRIKALL